jgi:hypothetical protein
MVRVIKRVVKIGIWIALGTALSYIVHVCGIPKLGQYLLPAHLIALIAGSLDGALIGGITGLMIPFVNFLSVGMPPFPNFFFMMIETFSYGFMIGLLKNKNIYLSLSISIVVGRIVYALVYYIFGTLFINLDVVKNFKVGSLVAVLLSFLVGIPGVVLQYLIVPTIVKRVKNTDWM